MTTLHIDFETRSAVDLKKTGVHRYAEDDTTDVWCACYAVDDGPVKLWRPGQEVVYVDDGRREDCPVEVIRAIDENWTIVAHNAQFERAIWEHVLHKRYGWSLPRLEQWRCTMAMAYAMGLPGSLDQASAALGLDVSKDMSGHRLMLQMSKPRAPRKTEAKGLYWWDDDERKQRLYAYCANDVEVERQLEKRLMPLSETEQALWRLDQTINDRGVHVDVHLSNAARKIVQSATERYSLEMRAVTSDAVRGVGNVAELVAFCRASGLRDVDSIAKDQLAELLARDDLAGPVRQALELRQEAAKASVAKIDALLNGTSKDGRARGLLQYHAASTGRWGGRRFQPQNLRRTSIKDVDEAIQTLRAGNVDLVELMHGQPLDTVSQCLRGMVNAAEGNEITAADLSNIEGRVLAWLAGQEWKLKAFADFDRGKGHDLYKLAYARAFAIKPEAVTDAQRQVGKVMELALGYQGGPGAFQTMAKGYGVRIGEQYEFLKSTAGGAFDKAVEAYSSRGRSSGIDRSTWIAAEVVKILWRAAHPKIVRFWQDLEDGALQALDGGVVQVGPVKFRKAGSFMWLRLPSGRALCYPYPHAVEKETPWGSKRTFAYKGVNSYSRKWEVCYAYGGLIAENVTQAVARDILAGAMFRIESAGYPIVLTVHDEVVSEHAKGFGSVDAFCALLTAGEPWSAGLPIAAAGWRGERYRK